MDKKFIKIFDYINRQGWDNSRWGLYTNANHTTIGGLFGPTFASRRACPDSFLYIWVGDDDADEMLGKLESNAYPDIQMTSKENETLLIWDLELTR